MTSELDIAIAAAMSPIALAALSTYVLVKLRHLEKRLEEQSHELAELDKKLTELLSLVKYMQGRVNGLEKRMEEVGRGNGGR